MYIIKTYKKILPDILVGFAIGVIYSIALVLWGASDTVQRVILAGLCILVLLATARATWSEKHSNDGDNSSDDSSGIVSVDGKDNGSYSPTNS